MSELLFPPRFLALAAEYPEWTLCRVLSQGKGQYRITSTQGEQFAVVSGKFRYETEIPSDYPTVGDYVMADTNYGDTAVIHHVLQRQSVFLRRAAGTAKKNSQWQPILIRYFCVCH